MRIVEDDAPVDWREESTNIRRAQSVNGTVCAVCCTPRPNVIARPKENASVYAPKRIELIVRYDAPPGCAKKMGDLLEMIVNIPRAHVARCKFTILHSKLFWTFYYIAT